MKKVIALILGLATVFVLILALIFVSYLGIKYLGLFGQSETAEATVITTEPSLADQPTPEAVDVVTDTISNTYTCTEAIQVPDTESGGRVDLNLDNGDSHSWSVTIINPDLPSSDTTLVIVTEPMWSFDIEYPVMYFTSTHFDGTQAEVLCSAGKMADNSGELFVYVGSDILPGWQSLDSTGWWEEMTTWQFEAEAIDAGVVIQHFIVGQDVSRIVDATDVVLAHGQFWLPGYPGKVVHPQVASGFTLTLPSGWQGTWWSYSAPNADIQSRIIEATAEEVVIRDEIGTVVLLFCGPADSVPTTSFDLNGSTVTWVTNLDGWTCTAPASE